MEEIPERRFRVSRSRSFAFAYRTCDALFRKFRESLFGKGKQLLLHFEATSVGGSRTSSPGRRFGFSL